MTPEELAESSEWLDGPRLVEWIEERCSLFNHGALTGSDVRRIHAWRGGGTANFYAVDPILLRLNLHPASQLPPRLFLPRRRYTAHVHIPILLKKMVAHAYRTSGDAPKVGKRFGVCSRSVRNWAAAL